MVKNSNGERTLFLTMDVNISGEFFCEANVFCIPSLREARCEPGVRCVVKMDKRQSADSLCSLSAVCIPPNPRLVETQG